MKIKASVSVIIAVLMLPILTGAQDNSAVDVKKFEVAPELATISFEPDNTKLGLGGRLTYNLNKHFALEAAYYFFPEDCNFCGRLSGRTNEGLFGAKIGKRFQKWGIFGKVRPGLIHSSKGRFEYALAGNSPFTLNGTQFFFVQKPETALAVDVGGVLEFYPTKRIITRLDFGGTIIRFGRYTANFPSFDPVTETYSLKPFKIPTDVQGTIQIMASVGFRF
jgi:hypothetical protein